MGGALQKAAKRFIKHSRRRLALKIIADRLPNIWPSGVALSKPLFATLVSPLPAGRSLNKLDHCATFFFFFATL